MLAGLILRFLCSVAGLWVAAHVVHGISYDAVGSLLAAALILGVLNAVLRPILVVLTLPITILTLGLFLLILNAGMLALTARFLHGFHVHGFWAALWGSLIVGVAGWMGSVLIER
jgi:putative membrane protein